MTDDGDSDDKVVRLTPRATTPSPLPRIDDSVEQVLREALGDLEDDRLEADDRVAIASEVRFIRRFGFDACRARRRQVLEFKHAKDLTDREIRFLHHTGCLDFRDGRLRIEASLFIAVFGWCLELYVALLMGLALIQVMAVSHPPMLVIGRLVAFEGMMIVVMVLAQRFYVQPRRILRRTRLTTKACACALPERGVVDRTIGTNAMQGASDHPWRE